MHFRTELEVAESAFKIEHNDTLFFIGSCFAENIAEKTKSLYFDTCINPHGILYNPKSIAIALNDYCINKKYTSEDLVYFNNFYHSLNHHGRYSHTQINECLRIINNDINYAHQFLKKCNYVLITLGSAFVYKHIETNKYVANCHKIPNKEFLKELLTIENIISDLNSAIIALNELNANVKIIFTISPVRYIRDGIIENNLSKARLIEAVHTICNSRNNCFYFPAYELIIDDLRDYRFYKDDLVHPTDFAVNYVWNKFTKVYFSNQCLNIIKQIEEINKMENHRPISCNYQNLNQFQQIISEKKNKLKAQYPYLKI